MADLMTVRIHGCRFRRVTYRQSRRTIFTLGPRKSGASRGTREPSLSLNSATARQTTETFRPGGTLNHDKIFYYTVDTSAVALQYYGTSYIQ